MEKARQVKILSIVALVVAIAGMTLGFAAFSTTLNISSSANVTPSSEDFKIRVYGFKDDSIYDEGSSIFNFTDDDLSDSYGTALMDGATGTIASIDNSAHVITNLNVNFENKTGEVMYSFVIKNEGKYDAYLDLSNLIYSNGEYGLGNIINKSCFAGDGTTESLVDQACDGISALAAIIDKETGDGKYITDDFYKIQVNDYEHFVVIIRYDGPFADGPFDVEFEDFQLKFSTTK